MYNKELKEKFISEFTTNINRRRTCTTLFEALEKYENEWHSDFCTMHEVDIKPVVADLIGIRVTSERTRLSVLRAYVRWCLTNGVDGACGDLLEIKDFGVEKFKKQTVANPRQLQRFLNCILDPESEGTVDNVYRCYYWLAFAGIGEEDAFLVNGEDVDLTEMVINYNGREYPIYREGIRAFKNCKELKFFKFKHPNYTTKDIYKTRAVGDLLLRGMSNKKSIKAMRVEMSKKQKNQKYRLASTINDKSLDLQLSYYRVALSGIFYRVYEAERAGMPVDFMDVAESFMEGKTYHLESGRNLIGAKQRQIASEYLEDYNRWKEAFLI